jgi:class 3 adenylate cyclase
MRTLPSGVVALLLADVEASTANWNTDAVEMEAALSALDDDVCSIVTAHDGVVVKARGEGDSHFCVFEMASSAVSAAAAIQRRRDRRLAVRIAVLLGEARPRDGDYVGAIVNHGARIRSTAHGGQVVVTSSVVEVVRGRLADDLTFRSLGTHRVRDVPTGVELFQLHGPGLRRSFPPLRTRAHEASTVMAVAVVDEVGASHRVQEADDELLDWQRGLIETFRQLSDHSDGRYLKIVGDGCLVGFEDPRAAMEFARASIEQLPVRVGIALGVIDVVEGELTGRVVFDAYGLVRHASQGEIRVCPLMASVCGSDH